jgi:hypothetical protein
LGLFGLLNENSLLNNSDEEWFESVKRQGAKYSDYLMWDTKKLQSDVSFTIVLIYQMFRIPSVFSRLNIMPV